MLPSLHRLPVRPTGMPAKTRRVTREEREAAEKELARQEANVSDLTKSLRELSVQREPTTDDPSKWKSMAEGRDDQAEALGDGLSNSKYADGPNKGKVDPCQTVVQMLCNKNLNKKSKRYCNLYFEKLCRNPPTVPTLVMAPEERPENDDNDDTYTEDDESDEYDPLDDSDEEGEEAGPSDEAGPSEEDEMSAEDRAVAIRVQPSWGQSKRMTLPYTNFLCIGDYSPYSNSENRWQRQFALFCNVVYGQRWAQWSATRNDVFSALKNLRADMKEFPPLFAAGSESGGNNMISKDVFSHVRHLDFDYLPGSVLTIRSKALQGCAAITRMHLPFNLRAISEHAFDSTGLKEIDIPESVNAIHHSAFKDCKSLQRVTIRSIKLEQIDDFCFYGCNNLKEITIPPTVEAIAVQAFHSCASLSHIRLPEALETIGYRAFKDCIELQTIEWNEKLHTIDADAFEHCRSLTTIMLPASVNDLQYRAFFGCTSLFTVDQLPQQPAPPGLRRLLGVREIPSKCFKKCSSLVTAPLLRTVITIGEKAFYKCEELASFKEKHLFEECTQLETLRESAFEKCTDLAYVYLPDTVQAIGKRVFRRCTSLREVRLPLNYYFKTLGEFAFAHTGLTSILLPANIQIVGRGAFYNCSKLETLTFATNQVTGFVIRSRAFQDCVSLKRLVLPDTLEIVAERAFAGCTSLESVTFSRGPLGHREPRVWRIMSKAFECCTSLKELHLPHSVHTLCVDSFHDTTGTMLEGLVVTIEGRGAMRPNGRFDGIVYTYPMVQGPDWDQGASSEDDD